MTATALYGMVLAAGVLAVALALIVWHRVEARAPLPLLSKEDEVHFARQGVRRRVVAGVMLVLSALIFVGSRMDHRRNGGPNPVFIVVWLVVFGLVLVLLVLAGVDWLATRRFARRSRGTIVREGMALLREEMMERARAAAADRLGVSRVPENGAAPRRTGGSGELDEGEAKS